MLEDDIELTGQGLAFERTFTCPPPYIHPWGYNNDLHRIHNITKHLCGAPSGKIPPPSLFCSTLAVKHVGPSKKRRKNRKKRKLGEETYWLRGKTSPKHTQKNKHSVYRESSHTKLRTLKKEVRSLKADSTTCTCFS